MLYEVITLIGIQYADQRHVVEVMTLGQHLRAYQHVDPSGADLREDFVQRALAARRIPVEQRDFGLGMHRAHLVADALRAGTYGDSFCPASRALPA